MPMIELKMTEGRSALQKVRFVREVTALASKILECPPEAVQVLISDHYSLHEWGVGGKTWEEIQNHGEHIEIVK